MKKENRQRHDERISFLAPPLIIIKYRCNSISEAKPPTSLQFQLQISITPTHFQLIGGYEIDFISLLKLFN